MKTQGLGLKEQGGQKGGHRETKGKEKMAYLYYNLKNKEKKKRQNDFKPQPMVRMPQLHTLGKNEIS